MKNTTNPVSTKNDDPISRLAQALNMSSDCPTFSIVGGRELLFYGIKPEDRQLWAEMKDYGDDISIQNVIKAGKAYLFTHVIGNPNDPTVQLLRHNEAAYGNITLHNRMVNAHDQSVIKLRRSNSEREKLLLSNCKGSDYILRYYELKQINALKVTPEKAKEKRDEIIKAITFRDVQGKTPLLLACKNVNQSYGLRLINLDETGTTLNMCDNKENRTPLHIACILGLTEVAQLLLKRGADQTLIDKYGHPPFYYLSCSQEEKWKNIQDVLDSVNFFAGRYFDPDDAKSVYQELLARNESLQKELCVVTQTTENNSTTTLRINK